MLTKIEDREIMSIWDAKKKYATKYFCMIITEKVDGIYGDLGYVIYTGDSQKDLSNMPREDYIGKSAGFFDGYSVEPYPIMDRIVYYD